MLLILLVAGVPVTQAIEPIVKVKAAYLYQFTKFIHWPDDRFDSSTSPFQICIAASDVEHNDLVQVLNLATVSRKSAGRSIRIKTFQVAWDSAQVASTLFSQTQGCHLLYLQQPTAVAAEKVVQQFRQSEVFLISDQESLSSLGIHSLLLIRDNRLVFFLNPQAIRESRLTVDATLLQLAKMIE